MTALATTRRTDLQPVGARLYLWDVSPFCNKVRMAAAHEGVAFEEVPAGLPELMQAEKQTGLRKVPVIEVDGTWITDSTHIVRWLEEQVAEPSLYPTEPEDRLWCEWVEDWADEALNRLVEPALWLATGNLADLMAEMHMPHAPSRWAFRVMRPFLRSMWRKRAAWSGGPEASRQAALGQLDLLERRLVDRRWLFGEQPTIADFAVAAQLRNPLHHGGLPGLEEHPEVIRMARAALALLPGDDGAIADAGTQP